MSIQTWVHIKPNAAPLDLGFDTITNYPVRDILPDEDGKTYFFLANNSGEWRWIDSADTLLSLPPKKGKDNGYSHGSTGSGNSRHVQAGFGHAKEVGVEGQSARVNAS